MSETGKTIFTLLGVIAFVALCAYGAGWAANGL